MRDAGSALGTPLTNDGARHARLRAQLTTLVNIVEFTGGNLAGEMLDDIGTEDANRRPYHLHLGVRLRGNALNGAVRALSWRDGPDDGAPERRVGNGLSYWLELRKERSR